MINPTIRSFSQDIEVRFLEEEAVPEEIRDWWIATRENLERLKDKITDLQTENESLKSQLSSISNQFTEDQALQLARFIQFWEIASDGSLIPYTNNASDLGSAERKVRDIYEAI
jgi:gas vesicle protein